MPEKDSERVALIRANSRREARQPWRERFWKAQAVAATRGMTARATTARRALRLSRTMTPPPITKMSRKRLTSTEVYISLSASTSLVTRVTTRPAGWRSK